MVNKSVIVFDIGGTYFRFNVVNEDLELMEDVSENKIKSPNFQLHPDFSGDKLVSTLINEIIKTIDIIKKKYLNFEIDGIGISFPGPVDFKGKVRSAPPIWGDLVKDYPLKKKLESILPHKVFVLNDVSASCWYYKNKFEDKRFCVITVSTGIGNKIFDIKHQDKIITQPDGLGGEIGHASIECEEFDLICDCGFKNHLSAIASGRGTERYAKIYSKKNKKEFSNSILATMTKGNPDNLDSFILIQAVKKGDQFARDIVKNTSRYMSLMIQQINMTIGVEKFIIIGGYALSLGEDYRNILLRNIHEMGIWGLEKNSIDNLIVLGENNDKVNLIGVGEYVFYNLHNE